MNRTLMTLTAAFGLAALPVLAEQTATVTDSNGDGVYSPAELKAALPEITGEKFVAIDHDADGSISPAELHAALDSGALTSGR